MVPWTRDLVLGQFWKLGFFSVRECEIFAHWGHLCKFFNCEHVARNTTYKIPKNSYMSHLNPVLMHSFHSMPQVGIQQVSLKVCRRWDSMCHRIMTIARIEKPSAPLDFGHRDSARVAL